MSALFRALHFVLWLGLLKGSAQGLGIPPTSGNAGLGATNQATYFYTEPGGSYSFGYKTDTGMEGQQSANQANEVTGHYSFYQDGVPYLVKYTAGVNGYRPEIFVGSNAAAAGSQSPPSNSFSTVSAAAPAPVAPLNVPHSQPLQLSFGNLHRSLTGDTNPSSSNNNKNSLTEALNKYSDEPQPYSFSYNSDLSMHSESSDKEGNVVGKYSYVDRAGYHDLSYKADGGGFTVLGGSLATPPPAPATQPPGIFNFNVVPLTPGFTKSSLLTSPAVEAGSTGEKTLRRRSLRKFRRYTKW